MSTKKNAKYGPLKPLGKATVHYPDSPSPKTLETFRNEYSGRTYWIRFECQEFVFICPTTAQPDFARITIDYVPDKLCIESKSLESYLASYQTGSFNQEIVNRILEDLLTACRPRHAIVYGEFASRDGISGSFEARYPDSSASGENGLQMVQSPREKETEMRNGSHL
jgi:7-cyano-7-deazaguanine reductase